jgi:hypothetical protein
LPVVTDFIFGPGTSVGVVQGVFLRFTNNVSSAQFFSAAATNSQGQYTMPLMPPGTYTVATGPATPAGPWTTYDPNYVVGDTPSDHILTSGTAPTISSVNVGISGAPTVVGNDQAGLVTFTTTGAAPAANTQLFQVNFATAYGFAPAAFLTHDNVQSAASNAFAAANVGTGSFQIFNVNALANTTTYVVAYFVVQPRVI